MQLANWKAFLYSADVWALAAGIILVLLFLCYDSAHRAEWQAIHLPIDFFVEGAQDERS